MDATARRDERDPVYVADGGDDEDEETPLQQVAAGVVTAVVLLVAFSLMFAGFEFFWVAFVVGFGGLLPLAVALVQWYESTESREADRRERAPQTDATADALATLRDRYARGDIDEAEFEGRLDALLRTESLDDARADAERRAAERDRERERTAELEPERERDE